MRLKISDYPQLSQIAWSRRTDDVIDDREALALYERHWHYISPAALEPAERQLIERLTRQLGGGVLNV